MTYLRSIAKICLYGALVPVSVGISLASLAFWRTIAILGLERPLDQRGDQLRVVVVAPFAGGDESGGAKAVEGLLNILRDRIPFYFVSVRQASISAIRGGIAAFALKALPVPNECKWLLLGSREIEAAASRSTVAWFEFMATGAYLLFGRLRGARVVLRDHEVLVRRLWMEVRAARAIPRLVALLRLVSVYAISAAIYSRTNLIITLTGQDRRAIQSWFPFISKKVICIPAPFAASGNQAPIATRAGSRELVMVANFFHSPNLDGLRWFLKECGPLLGPGYTLHLCGFDAPLDAVNLSAGGMRVVRHGFLRDPLDVRALAPIAVAPLVTGGGVRIKNIFLGSLGMALVTTPLGNEGIEFENGKHALICADAKSMVAGINFLVDRPDEIARLGAAARDHVSQEFEPSRIEGLVLAAVASVVDDSSKEKFTSC